MNRNLIILMGMFSIASLCGIAKVHASTEGYYKDIFFDAGVGLDDMTKLYAGDYLKYSYEYYSGESADTQNLLMVKNADDDNGVLLYPDGEPRFTILYTCGGYGEHATSLGNEGKQRVRDFYYHGGSYTGTCHGNYLTCGWGYNWWPGKTKTDTLEGSCDGIIPDNSPLLRYYDFGGDHLIAKLGHYMGGYGVEPLPAKTELLLIHKNNTELNGKPAGWAYKENDTTGRSCGLTDHPEYAPDGERMQYLAASFQYCRDGLAPPHVKATLVSGKEHVMDKSTADKDFAHTKIGDKQYHHFRVSLPGGVNKLTVTLDADDAYDMNLYIAKDTFALASRAKYADTSKGADKILAVSSPESGTWYIGVECATTVNSEKNKWGYKYTGNRGVLNGVKYSIKADWMGETYIDTKNNSPIGMRDQLLVQSTGGMVLIQVGTKTVSALMIYDVNGRFCWAAKYSRMTGIYTWQPEHGGMYLVRFTDKKNVITKRFIIVK
jgi:hypothetical protein